jgi:catechol 2,3-dioxygenase
MTSLPELIIEPPFRVTRTSHVVMHVKDVGASVAFYSRALGLVITEQRADIAYLRGIEEVCHHSLVLKRADVPACARVGFRVYSEADLDIAAKYFAQAGGTAAFVDVPYQGKTLHVTDPFGFQWEFCVCMDVVPRMLVQFHEHRGGSALRLDHVQVLTPDVEAANRFYMAIGFRCTEYIVNEAGVITGVFLQRKGNTHDLVFVRSTGPRIHHFAFMTPDSHTLIHACDTAGQLGYGAAVSQA